ncbi:hypothetical protein T459_22806 [Capsicum annuum]|uniref:Uncharacterized protein n=1 Tax=Capsicum annuum TaxID=4072 RepID=A0A2G2YQX4_CAPAN|nr:hypothetical protein T459_22806 [Capsicum annuum]
MTASDFKRVRLGLGFSIVKSVAKMMLTKLDHWVDLDVEACFDTPIWISFTILDIWMWKYSSQADTSTDPDIPNIKRQSISELEGDAIVDGCNCESEHLSGSEVPPQFLSSRYLPKFL